MASLNVPQAWAQHRGDLFDTRDGSSCAGFCTCHSTLPLPPLPATPTPRVDAWPEDADRGQPGTWPKAWRRQMSGSSDSSLKHLSQEKQWESCQLAEKPSLKSRESCQDVEGAGSRSRAWKRWRTRLAWGLGGQADPQQGGALHLLAPTPREPSPPGAILGGSLLLPFSCGTEAQR